MDERRVVFNVQSPGIYQPTRTRSFPPTPDTTPSNSPRLVYLLRASVRAIFDLNAFWKLPYPYELLSHTMHCPDCDWSSLTVAEHT